jgi:hypothetical protein
MDGDGPRLRRAAQQQRDAGEKGARDQNLYPARMPMVRGVMITS